MWAILNGIRTFVKSLRLLGDFSLVGPSSKIVAEGHTATSGKVVSVASTPASASTAVVMQLAAEGTNWGAGSAVLKLVSDDADARVLRVFSASLENLDINKNGTITTSGSLILSSGGQIITTNNGDITILPNGTGITAVGNAGSPVFVSALNDNLFVSGQLEVTGEAWLNGDPYVPNNYAGLSINDNAVVTTIPLVDSYIKITDFDSDLPAKVSSAANATDDITIGASGDYEITADMSGNSASVNKVFEWDVFDIDQNGTTVTAATEATPCVVTMTGHPLINGDHVKFFGVGGMVELNDRIFVVANAAANTVELTDEEGVDIASGAFTTFTTGGTGVLATKTGAHDHRKFAAIDIGSFGGGTISTLVSGDTLELYIKGVTDDSNFIHEHINFRIGRKG